MSSSVTRTIACALLALAPGAARAQSVEEGRRNDLAAFRRDFYARDSSYPVARRAKADSRLRALESKLGTLTAAQFELELARIVALADNGHTNSPASLRSRRYARVPLRLVPFGDQFHVLAADTALADLLGARLVAIDGKSMNDIRSAGHVLWGGTPAWRDRQLPFLLESPEQMLALGITTAPGAAVFRFALRNGRTVDRRIAAEPPNAGREVYPTTRWLYPEAVDPDRGDWRLLGTKEQSPWAFQELSQLFRLRVAPELNAVIVQLRANHDGPQPIQEFLRKASEEIQRVKPRNLVLDLRVNGGGDLNNTRDFVQSLPGLVPGRIFVLTSPWTFSAAISTTGYLKQAGGGRVTIVGEMVGDRLEFWAEGRLARLPYSGAAMSYSTQRHDYKTGCKPYTDCHGAVVRNPISVPSLAPDIPAPLTIEDFIAGRDPGMEAIASALARKQ
jgi:hypothetical protein